MALLIKNGTLVTSEGVFPGELRIEGDRIQAVGSDLPAAPGDEVLDAADCYVLPGGIDPHVHFNLRVGNYRTVDDFAAGTRSAACGGVTTVIDFVSEFPDGSLLKGLEARLAEMEGQLHIDVGLHMTVTGRLESWEEELPEVAERGVTSVKVYTTYRQGGFYCDDHTWYRLLVRARDLGLVVLVHAENDAIVEGTKAALAAAGKTGLRYHPESRPGLAELEAVQRGLFLAEQAGGAPIYFVHLSVGEAPWRVAEAWARGLPAMAEVCVHHLLLDEEDYAKEPPRYYMTPPLRTRADRERLWEALEEGSVDTVATDHCAYDQAQRLQDDDLRTASPGVPGVETRLPLLYTYGVDAGRISLPQMVALLSTNPARIFGLYPRKGALLPGSDADVVLYDPRPVWTLTDSALHSNAGFTPYAGMRVQGRVRTTISRGRILWHEGEFRGAPEHGRFVERERFQ